MKVKNLHKQNMEVIQKLINNKLKNENIQAVILGGSVARGDETEHSDIDIVFYVKKKDLPKNSRRFYKFKGKYIEEHYSDIKNLKSEEILPESKILYDKKGEIKKEAFNEKHAKNKFKIELQKAKRNQKLAEKFLGKENYEESFKFLYGLESPAFILMHALPPKFNLPYPSFRLLKSLNIIDKKYKTKTYNLVKELYTFKNKNIKEIMKKFQNSYFLMNKIKRFENSGHKNLGFFDKVKIKYNIEGLKRTFEDYPFVYAYRFLVGCLAMWVFDKSIPKKQRKQLKENLFKILGVSEIDKKLIERKIKLSSDLIKECEKLR